MNLIRHFNEPIQREILIEEEKYNITFKGVCDEKQMIWGTVQTEDGPIDMLIPASMLIINNQES